MLEQKMPLEQIFSISSLSALGLAQASPWFVRTRRYIEILGLIALGAALVAGRFSLKGLAPYILLLEFFLFWALYTQPLSSGKRTLFAVGAFGIGIALIKHWIPGVYNWCIAPHVQLSPHSASFDFWFNFDKPFLGVMILAFYSFARLQKGEGKTLSFWVLSLTLGCVSVLVGSGFIMGMVAWDPKIPPLLPLWAINNLLFVCTTEEAFFRFYVQNSLEVFCRSRGLSWLWGLIGASFLFSLIHISGGPVYAGLSFIAGLFYGYAFHQTGRIEASILVHFFLNLTHFLLFTYPFRI